MYVINMNMIMNMNNNMYYERFWPENNSRRESNHQNFKLQEYILVICIKTKRINSNQTFKYGRKGKVWLPAEGHIRCTLNI